MPPTSCAHVGALRFASSTVFGRAATPSFTPVCRRFLSLSTQCVPRQSVLKTSNYGIFSRYKHPGQPFSPRYLSLGSIFSRNKPSPSPSPLTVAHITSLESEANTNNHDVPKQLALFQALIQTDLRPGYELVTTRWERMCEFDSSSPLLKSDEAFQIYLTALLRLGNPSKIPAAVRRRDSLLIGRGAATIPSQTEGSEAVAEGGVAAALAKEPSGSLLEGASGRPVSKSQEIADSVLSAQALGSTGTPVPPGSDMAKLAAAIQAAGGSAAAPVQVSIVERKGAWAPRLTRFIILTALGSFFILIIFAVLLENSGLMKAGPRQAEFVPSEGKTVTFSDVHGVDEVKDELKDVVAFLKDPTTFATLGGKLPKGVLLTGSPGTGKTLLARAVAGEAGVPFFFASGSDFEEMFVGVGAKRVRDLFAAARKKQPAIIFIDELDAVGGKRSSRDQQYMKQTLNQLLVEMDGFMQTEGIIVIAATNFPESLDSALIRPGRFDRTIAVPLPDIRGRVQILNHHMKGVTTSPDVDPTILARGTPGFSGADLQNMVNQAAIQASKERATEVTLKHFEWAKDRIVMGAERKSQYIDPKAKLATAFHEGGHALVALYTDGAMPLHKVTCVPRGHALGVTSQLPEDDQYSVSFKQYRAAIDVCLGGRVAEELTYGTENVSSGASSDLQKATGTATAMVKYWGFSDKIGRVYYGDRDNISPQRRIEIEDEIRKLIQNSEERVTKLLKEKQEELHRLAHALVEHETLDADEVKKVIKGEQIRNISEILQEELSQTTP
ncbi:ATP-dependent metallopeptidase Hfl [Pleurotus eryngii]|uniref:ATP-dependent metallopeptidase Hfl n=1 Tax=Pleurotus eryngii TaxID=5323 RepID=A0A9P6DDJ6_PLEER|nr:ATP-dependent metallopeptidase Hfl [Pleurotus eryngii]